jgi:hypothetical protein
MNNILVYGFCWFGMVILAILNGLMRNSVYGPHMRELAAHQLSTLTGIILFGIYIYILTGIWPIESAKQAFLIGGIWLGMTILFEFVFGHFVMGHPWSKLLHDYNLLQGRIWILMLIWTGIAPYLFYQLRISFS